MVRRSVQEHNHLFYYKKITECGIPETGFTHTHTHIHTNVRPKLYQ